MPAIVGLVYVALVIATIWSFVRVWKSRRRSRWCWFIGCLCALVCATQTLCGPSCVYLPRVPGRPAVMKRLVGVDGDGHVHWLEAERDLGFAWGPRWWFEGPVPGVAGFEFVPPFRFARAPWLRWRMVRSDGLVRPYEPPFATDPGETLVERYSVIVPEVTADGSWLTLSNRRAYSCLPDASHWTSVPVGVPDVAPTAVIIARARRATGSVLRLHRIRQPDGGPHLDFRQDQLVMTESDLTSGREVRRAALRLPGERPAYASRYDLHLVCVDSGTYLFEAYNKIGVGPAGGAVYCASEDLGTVVRFVAFECSRIERANYSVSADGAFFSTGDAVYRMTGERLESVGPFSSTVWVGHTLVGVRPYPYFGELVRETAKPFVEILRALRDPARRQRLGEPGLGGREVTILIQANDGAGAAERGRWWFGGIDESGKSDDIERVVLP